MTVFADYSQCQTTMSYKLESDSSDKSDSEDEFPRASADPDLARPDLINLDLDMETETSDSDWTYIEIVEMETDFSASSSERSNHPVVNMIELYSLCNMVRESKTEV